MNFETPAIDRLRAHLVQRWPDHRNFVEKSFTGRSPELMRVSEELAGCIIKLAEEEDGGLDALCDDYRFLCEEIVLPEEIHFRRHGSYRLSNFDEANAECYANGPFMARYMNGLLLSDLFWVNHAGAFASFANDYLPLLETGSSHLEIGPGHGMFLYFAAKADNVGKVAGWDISPTSIDKTRHALELLGVDEEPVLQLQDMFEAPETEEAGRYDSLAMSEILEHLEDPVAALKAASRHVSPGGYLFVNVPANSPAPDHIFLFDNLEHAVDIVEQSGFAVEQSFAFPMVGLTLEQARKHKASVSCVVIARKAAD